MRAYKRYCCIIIACCNGTLAHFCWSLSIYMQVFGPAWADRMLLPRVLALRSDPSFTIRLTALLAAAVSYLLHNPRPAANR